MIVLAEFLMACGLVAIVGALFYSGYKTGREVQKEEDNK